MAVVGIVFVGMKSMAVKAERIRSLRSSGLTVHRYTYYANGATSAACLSPRWSNHVLGLPQDTESMVVSLLAGRMKVRSFNGCQVSKFGYCIRQVRLCREYAGRRNSGWAYGCQSTNNNVGVKNRFCPAVATLVIRLAYGTIGMSARRSWSRRLPVGCHIPGITRHGKRSWLRFCLHRIKPPPALTSGMLRRPPTQHAVPIRAA